MDSITVFSFDSQDIRFINGKPVANDVAAVLGYADPVNTIRKKVKDKNKGVARIQTPGGMQNVVVLESEGVLQLVSSSRLPNAIDIAKQVGLQVLNCKHEQESLRIIQAAFEDLSPSFQHRVDEYRIDLYLKKANIAIECDENNHAGQNYFQDKKRENWIKAKLNCIFVRYNPDEPGFNVGNVIRQIRKLLTDVI